MRFFYTKSWLCGLLAVSSLAGSGNLKADTFKFTCYTQYFLKDRSFSISGEINETGIPQNLYSYFDGGFYFSAKSTVHDANYSPKSSKYKNYNLFQLDLWDKANAFLLKDILGGDALMLPKDLQGATGTFTGYYRQQDGQGGSYNSMICRTGTMIMFNTALEIYLYRAKYENTNELTRRVRDDVDVISKKELVDSMNQVARDYFSNWFVDGKMHLENSAEPWVVAEWIDSGNKVIAKEVISKNTYIRDLEGPHIFTCHHFLLGLDGKEFFLLPNEDCRINFGL